MAAQPFHQRLVTNRRVIFFCQRHLDTGKQQKRTEQVQQPLELGHQPAAGENHDSTQHDRAQYAKDQHPTLQVGRNGKVAEQHQPDEDVIDRQRFFDQITGEEGQRLGVGDGAPGGLVQVVPEAQVEQQREADPHQRPTGGLLERHGVCAFAALQQ
ncbi:hypothetical protein D3C78_1227760 [compost metagenome]